MFNEKLKTLRIANEYSQKDFALKLGIDPSTYCCYENGARKPNLDTINRIISIFGEESYILFDYPILNEVIYPEDMLDNFELILKQFGHPGTNYNEDRANYEKLKEAFQKINEIRNEALSFPNLNLSKVTLGTTVKIVKLDIRGENLIDQCIQAQSLLIDSMYNRK